MKKLWPILFSLAIAIPTFAQDKTTDEALLDEEDVWQLYTKVSLKYTEIGADSAEFAGLEIGRVLNEKLGFAVSAYTLINDVEAENSGFSNMQAFDTFYGGLTLERYFSPDELIHGSFYLFMGGGILYFEGEGDSEVNSESETDFWMVEPGVNVLINITQTIEFGTGLGYRYTNGSDHDEFKDSDISSYVVNVFFRFTEF